MGRWRLVVVGVRPVASLWRDGHVHVVAATLRFIDAVAFVPLVCLLLRSIWRRRAITCCVHVLHGSSRIISFLTVVRPDAGNIALHGIVVLPHDLLVPLDHHLLHLHRRRAALEHRTLLERHLLLLVMQRPDGFLLCSSVAHQRLVVLLLHGILLEHQLLRVGWPHD